jgi:hypothetical protein
MHPLENNSAFLHFAFAIGELQHLNACRLQDAFGPVF